MPRTRAVTLLLGAALLVAAHGGPRSLERLSYVESPDPAAPEQQSLDLYLPAAANEPVPLVVFVHSRFWSSAPGGRVIYGIFAKPLLEQGAAVAIVRHRLAPAHRHPAGAQDVAAALRFLVDNASRYGYDPQRIFLAGHSSGAHLAALVALDPRYLAAEGLERSAIAGVVAISGAYDLDPGPGLSAEELAWYEQTFGDAAARRDASPQRWVRADAPRFLVLSAQDDIPGYARGGDAFAAALRDAGHTDAEFYVVMGRNHVSILDLGSDRAGTPMYVLDFLGLQPLPPAVAELRDASRFWRSPPFSTEPFWTSGAPVVEHPADERFVASTANFFQGLRHKRITFRPERFQAIDLFELLDVLGPEAVGEGDWLVTTNVQQEKGYFRLEDLRAQRPVVVIGIDADRNLFRNVDVFRAKREYSWRDDLPAPTYSVRPMGAFLYLLEPPPDAPLPSAPSFSLSLASFRLQDEDPLAPLRDLDALLVTELAGAGGCVRCHSLRGVGSRAGHLRALDGELQGGFALPLEEYPAEVWKRFVFEPQVTAELLGVPLRPVSPAASEPLFEVVEAERARSGTAQAP
jgi:acetyl esterase/lipase